MDIKFEDINLDDAIFIDTRSPSEFHKGHIVGSINIPLLNNEERAIVGTIYKKEGQESAIRKGLKLAGPNFVNIYNSLLKLQRKNTDKQLIIYCARGGMRSGTVHSFMNSLKIKSFRLVGGYKRYRNIVLDTIENKISKTKFIILTGNTGSGKTTILKKMKKKRLPIIDLEGIAQHMGSAFGAIPYNEVRTTQQQFENRLATSLIKLNNPKIVFLEGESKRIGWVNITPAFHEKMRVSDTVIIKRTERYRIRKILEDYDIKNEGFKDALDRIKKKLGGVKHKEISIMLENNQDEDVIRELLISYYDKLYNHSINRQDNIIETIESEDDEEIIDRLITLM